MYDMSVSTPEGRLRMSGRQNRWKTIVFENSSAILICPTGSEIVQIQISPPFKIL